MNNSYTSWIENGFHKSFFKGKIIESINITGSGILDIYFSPGPGVSTGEITGNQCVKITSFDVCKFPVGFTEILQHYKAYDFTYVYKGDNNFSSASLEDFRQFAPFINDDDTSVKLAYQCLLFAQSMHLSLLELIELNQETEQFIRCITAFYWYLKESFNLDRMSGVKFLADGMKYYQQLKNNNLLLADFPLDQFDTCLNYFSETPEQKWYDLHAGKYINALLDMNEELRERFLRDNISLVEYHCIEAAKTATQYKKYFKNEIILARQLLSLIFNNTNNGVITELLRIYADILNSGNKQAMVLDFIFNIVERFNSMVNIFEEKYELQPDINLSKLNILINSIRSEYSRQPQKIVSDSSGIPLELGGSLNRILEYSGIEMEKKIFFRNFIENFKEHKPKIDQIPVETKRSVTSVFFELYESVLTRYIKEEPHDTVLDMFLTFGFVDSDLLLPQQVYDLYCFLNKYSVQGNVYSIKNWLTQIVLKNKPPSVNELGITYEQLLKESSFRMPANKHTVDTGEHRLHHEIMNLFRTCHRLCSGQSSTYFPVLCMDMFPEDIKGVIITPSEIRHVLQKILDKDYSAFHREVFYSGETEVFRKEIIMKQVLPDIILMPIMGSRALMWQELSEASKASPGRFVIPMLTSDNLELIFIRLVGQFRWELCRSIMGVRWNDPSYKTLTSVYSDYIDNYRKNKNLSLDMKDRVRSQIKRHRNNLKNIFTSDYEAWMRYEWQGMRKLNKEARAILYKFCPFSKKIRDELSKNPAFSEIASMYNIENERTIREIESRYANYVNRGYKLDKELEDNLRFYKLM